MFAYMMGGYAVFCIAGAFIACHYAPLIDDDTPEPVRFDPPVTPADDFLADDELLDEILAVEVDAFIAECLGGTA